MNYGTSTTTKGEDLLHEDYVLVVGDECVEAVLLLDHKNVTADIPFASGAGKPCDTRIDP